MNSSYKIIALKSPKDVFQTLNNLLAITAKIRAKEFIENKYFQKAAIPPETVLSVVDDLIRLLDPQEKDKYYDLYKDIPVYLRVLWNDVRGIESTPEDEKHFNAEKEIYFTDPFLFLIKWATTFSMVNNLCASVYYATNLGLWSHIPAITGYSAVNALGPKFIRSSVQSVVNKSNLTPSQKQILTDWLSNFLELGLGFITKVHATKEGVIYQSASSEGYTEIVSTDQTVIKAGNTQTIKKEGFLNTPEGDFSVKGEMWHKLNDACELTEKGIQMQCMNQEGSIAPVTSHGIQGNHGSEITSCNKWLESHWQRYSGSPKTGSDVAKTPSQLFDFDEDVVPFATQDSESSLRSPSFPSGLIIATIGSTVLKNPLPFAIIFASEIFRSKGVMAENIGESLQHKVYNSVASFKPPIVPKAENILRISGTYPDRSIPGDEKEVYGELPHQDLNSEEFVKNKSIVTAIKFSNGDELIYRPEDGLNHGIYKYKNGAEYRGMFKDGVFDGNGFFISAEGMEYHGHFKDGQFEGYGTLIFPNKSTYSGVFKNGEFLL